jgi:hypothetical protein
MERHWRPHFSLATIHPSGRSWWTHGRPLADYVKPFAVVFDIGGVARDNEHIHSAVLREVQKRLGYCEKSNLVADFELKLERDGEWNAFLSAAKKTLGKEWRVAKDEEQADDHFSHVLHVMKPDRYPEPTSWIDSRAGSRTGAGTSVKEVVDAIDAMIHIREEDKALFIVVDEVSQYVHQDENRMLKLQTLVATFVSPPYGYASDLVKACCAGLLRGKKIRIRPEQGDDITSYQDPGVRDLSVS